MTTTASNNAANAAAARDCYNRMEPAAVTLFASGGMMAGFAATALAGPLVATAGVVAGGAAGGLLGQKFLKKVCGDDDSQLRK